MRWTLISAVNSDEVLNANLLRSPDVAKAEQVLLKHGFAAAGNAINDALESCSTDIAVIAHQDVYFPEGWIVQLEEYVANLESNADNWGVIGVIGIDKSGNGCGHVYSSGLRCIVGETKKSPQQVVSVDEMVIILRTKTGLRFDAELPGFHLYGTDICLEAKQRGMASFVLPNFCMHNSNGLPYLPWSFWKAYRYMQRKWRHELPIKTPCVTLSPGLGYILRVGCGTRLRAALNRPTVGSRVADPVALYESLNFRREIAVMQGQKLTTHHT